MNRIDKVVALANRAATAGERDAAMLAAERLAALEGKEVAPSMAGIGVFDPERADLLRALYEIVRSSAMEVVVLDLATFARAVDLWGAPPSSLMFVYAGGRKL